MAESNPTPAVEAAPVSKPHPTDQSSPASTQLPAPSTTTKPAETSAEKTDGRPRSLEPALPVPTAAEKETGAGPRASSNDGVHGVDDDDVNPPDFQGSVLSNDDLPSPQTIRRIENYQVLDRYGKTHTFKSLYTGRNVARRVLIIFVRHFYCGNCQEYLRSLSASIKPDSLLHLPISTFIAVIGCGDPALIDMYAEATGCPYEIYADPTRKLYQELGMVKTLALGHRPAYMNKSLLKSSLDSIVQGVKQIKSGLAIKGGDQRQIGGEFLFEPLDLRSPQGSPVQEFDRKLRLDAKEEAAGGADGDDDDNRGPGREGQHAPAAIRRKPVHSRTASVVTDNDNGEVEDTRLVEEKRVTWCHRMRTTRDHAEIPELMEVLGLNGQGRPIKDQKRWSKALETRKGTGLSLASQMGQMGHRKTASAASSASGSGSASFPAPALAEKA